MYFPFLELQNWCKRSAEIRRRNCAVLPKVSTDYLLGVKSTATVSVEGLSEKDVHLITAVIARLREKGEKTL